MRKLAGVTLSAVLLAGCVQSYEPIVDPRSVPQAAPATYYQPPPQQPVYQQAPAYQQPPAYYAPPPPQAYQPPPPAYSAPPQQGYYQPPPPAGQPYYQPQQSRSSGNYYQDLAECRRLAEQSNGAVGEGAKQALVGAAVGAALGAATGGIAKGVSAGQGAAIGAAGGGILGGAHGVYSGYDGQKRIVDNCMRGRGYSVAN